jgi:hypothetical protein
MTTLFAQTAPPQQLSAGQYKALSVRQPWASLIADGQKTLEIRSRRTHYRGPLLICVSSRPRLPGLPHGVALCLVDLVDCRPMAPGDDRDSGVAVDTGLFGWVLANPRPVEPFPVSGQLGLFTVAAS